jgi:hypothetical protein
MDETLRVVAEMNQRAWSVLRDALVDLTDDEVNWRWPLTSGGSARPSWRRDGWELFYETRPEGILTAAAVSSAGARLEVGGTSTLFKSSTANTARRWDPAPDGQTFLVVLENAGGEIAPITLVVNWPAALGARESR